MIDVNDAPAANALTFVRTDDAAPSAVGLAVIVLRQRHSVLRIVLAALLFGLLGAILSPRDYTSISVFMAQGRSASTSASMSGLAAQLGLPVASGDPTQNPAFYADLLKARAILAPTVAAFYPALSRAYDVSAKDSAIAREATMEEFSRHVRAAVDPRTGVVRLSVTAPSAALAEQLNQKLLDLVNDFNLRSRQTQAGTERAFVERRLAEVGSQLRAAEDRLATFLASNRAYQNAPDLLFAYNRLIREVTDRQQLYSMLEQSYERSKIEEARDTPVITLVERPNFPVRPNSRGWGKKGALALVLGLFLGVTFAYVRALFGRGDTSGTAEYDEFARLVADAKHELRHPWRLFRRLLGGSQRPIRSPT